jgi:hypothetical protein
MRGSYALVFAMACGRLDFTDVAIATDALATSGACKWTSTAPNPLVISGTTIDYPTFTVSQPVPNIPVTIRDAITRDVLGSATSGSGSGDTAGTYAIELHDGVAHALEIDLGGVDGFYTTHQFTGGPVGQDLAGYQSPLWNAGAMGAVYDTIGNNYAQGSGSGTLTIQLEHCDSTFVGSGEVTVTPQPDVLAYLGSNAQPSSTGMTETTYGAAVAFNMPPSPVATITATAPGLTFETFEAPVYAGSNATVIVIYANE